MLGNI